MGLEWGQIRELPEGVFNGILEWISWYSTFRGFQEGSRMCPRMGQKWGPIWGSENDPFWGISILLRNLKHPRHFIKIHDFGVLEKQRQRTKI